MFSGDYLVHLQCSTYIFYNRFTGKVEAIQYFPAVPSTSMAEDQPVVQQNILTLSGEILPNAARMQPAQGEILSAIK